MDERRLKFQRKPFTATIPKWIKKLADPYGIEFRISEKPSEADIMGVDNIRVWRSPAVYLQGTGVIWVKKTQTFTRKCDADFMLLHELGHAIMDMFDWKKGTTIKHHEVMANSIALALAVLHNKPMSKALVATVTKFPGAKGLFVRPAKGLLQEKRRKTRRAK